MRTVSPDDLRSPRFTRYLLALLVSRMDESILDELEEVYETRVAR